MVNLLVYSNRYGYAFYATKNNGLAILSSAYIDQQCQHLSRSTEHDDDDDSNESNVNNQTIIYRSYLPCGTSNSKMSMTPYWLALNADDTILAIVLRQAEIHAWFIVLYDTVAFIRSVGE
jgi:hypothetical protein